MIKIILKENKQILNENRGVRETKEAMKQLFPKILQYIKDIIVAKKENEEKIELEGQRVDEYNKKARERFNRQKLASSDEKIRMHYPQTIPLVIEPLNIEPLKILINEINFIIVYDNEIKIGGRYASASKTIKIFIDDEDVKKVEKKNISGLFKNIYGVVLHEILHSIQYEQSNSGYSIKKQDQYYTRGFFKQLMWIIPHNSKTFTYFTSGEALKKIEYYTKIIEIQAYNKHTLFLAKKDKKFQYKDYIKQFAQNKTKKIIHAVLEQIKKDNNISSEESKTMQSEVTRLIPKIENIIFYIYREEAKEFYSNKA